TAYEDTPKHLKISLGLAVIASDNQLHILELINFLSWMQTNCLN
ncbi:13832_t:CDS:1, partial [Racocetra persica]